MKKFVTFIIAGAMMTSTLSTTAFAEGSINVTATRTTTISPTVATVVNGASDTVDATDPNAVISVTITWDKIDFVYNATTKWNPETDEYDETGSWDHTKGDISITNNSNCKINAEVTFDKTNTNTAYDNVDVRFANAAGTASGDIVKACIDSAVEGDGVKLDFNMVVSGAPNTLESVGSANLGNITVNITGADTDDATGVIYKSYTTGGSQDGDDNDT